MANFNPRTREGCDPLYLTIGDLRMLISIHAPVKGATSGRTVLDCPLNYFNPRTREGCDTLLL